ncbi:putative E3 ubiquitin-protein ligase UBR7 [Salarias fasciatus]|uniref:Putative E3 ubiquitin-protein ligase UBR7 n=1 Tax=Salarias fasciatus TaxID=181472 RepID=A0A672HIY5_SALFA|nr:putative E3 ubiquitin-protein ligase UBR7 [Salarias fasciatus]XP_029966448.1 putative E3 ubiquitin-protein ligase UBR7 [Salarias fasciatus]XP_029966449.1 putative E3 ubiquitin-protein ligase UBR7 [Salarias fasciatus]XP_029966451.1 putative E3 ubiquitin-protein ligase UBR7 [Salarias fasciatus]XP_029966452.1 putative E3 ubiquitin-protein ligase UBR7 [Salarias fasciatus]
MSEDQTVSLVDVLEEDEELEEEASAVLAGSDSDHCSYPQGYVKRQALYACNTCTPAGGEAAGVCLACSYKCHEGHDLFELYTKRNFRCDCGNRKFKDLQCKLQPEKDEVNVLNKYSQNFFGSYCTCSRPYPDPEDQVEDEMIQCVVCEDWFHSRHLGVSVPEGVELQEMVCESCMNQNPVLWPYADEPAGAAAPPEASGSARPPGEAQGDDQDQDQDQDQDEPSRKRVRREAEPGCRLKDLQARPEERRRSGAAFWPAAWRSSLCCCRRCRERLSAAGLSFLLDEADTVLAYENRGKSSEQGRQGHDPLMSALDNLNRVQQLEIIHGYNDMKSELKDFLQSFAAEGKVVTSDDIHHFFQQQSEKRRRESRT